MSSHILVPPFCVRRGEHHYQLRQCEAYFKSTAKGAQRWVPFRLASVLDGVCLHFFSERKNAFKGWGHTTGWFVVGAFGYVWLWHGLSFVFLDLVTIVMLFIARALPAWRWSFLNNACFLMCKIWWHLHSTSSRSIGYHATTVSYI